MTTLEKVLAHINKNAETGCWIWHGSKAGNGYGHTKINGKYVYIHRLLWEIYRGPIPKGMCVCHHCDNPPCANPDHLFIGTMADNMRDRDRKKRANYNYGEKCYNAKLSESQVKDIIFSSESPAILASKYGVCKSNICAIRRRETWKHIKV